MSSLGAIRVTVAAPATVAAVSGLTNGTGYTFTVTATSAAGTSPPSAPSNPVRPAAVPSSPTGVRAVSQNEAAAVAWTPPASDGGSPLTGYIVTASPGGLRTTVGPFATRVLLTNLANGTPYTFSVRGVNAVGPGAPSLPSSTVVPLGAPGLPSGVRAMAGNAGATVTWTPPASNGGAPLRGYTIVASPGGLQAAASPEATRAEVSGLLNGMSYTFTVAAANATGPGRPSAASNVVVPRTVPDAPGSAQATAGAASATVTWTPPAWNGGRPVTAYLITSQPDATAVMVDGSAASATVGQLANGTAYAFTVTAVNEAGEGAPSAWSNTVTPATVPDAPTGVFAEAEDGAATIFWEPPAVDGGLPVTGYTITTWPGGPTVHVGGGLTAARVSGLHNGTAYRFVVRARNPVGRGAASAASNSVRPFTSPGAPLGVAAVAGLASATVSWMPPASDGGSPITGYLVTASPGSVVAVVEGSERSTTVSGLENGTSYTFAVTAANAAGTGPASEPSPPVTPATVPDPPTDLDVVAESEAATVSWLAPIWDGGSPITGYVVTASSDGITATVEGDATSVTVTGLTNGITYTFTVHALNAAGASTASAPSDAVVPARTVPQAPLQVTADAGDSSATVSWMPPASDGGSAITAYAVTVWPDGYAVIVDGQTTSAILTNLVNGLVYNFTVTASNALGTGPPSEPSEPLGPAAAPDMPGALALSSRNGSLILTWDPPISDGGSPVIEYTVTIFPGGWTTSVDGDTTSVTLTDLTAGVAYTVAVTASNAVGTGPPALRRARAPAALAADPDRYPLTRGPE